MDINIDIINIVCYNFLSVEVHYAKSIADAKGWPPVVCEKGAGAEGRRWFRLCRFERIRSLRLSLLRRAIRIPHKRWSFFGRPLSAFLIALIIFLAIHKIPATYMKLLSLICIINISPITFWTLYKSSPD